jgi:hypothetical protein
MYFFRHITGAPLIDGDEEMTDAQRKKLEGKLSKKKIHWQGCAPPPSRAGARANALREPYSTVLSTN